MLARAALVAFIGWQALWLNVVLPGHTRGAITLPGAATPARAEVERGGAANVAHACCSVPRSHDDVPAREQAPKPGDRARCAICYFATGLSVPPAIDLAPAPRCAVDLLPVPPPDVVLVRDFPPAYHGRAPPTA